IEDFDGEEFTGFSTGKNGIQCQFNKQFRIYLAQLSEGLFPNFDKPIGIEEKQFRKILERSIVNIFTEDGFNIEDDSSKENLKKIRLELKALINELKDEYIHYIPAKTVQLELSKSIKIGDVEIYSIENWLNIVDYSEKAKENYYGNTEHNKQWKELVRRKLKNEEVELNGIANDMFKFIEGNNAIIKITVKGYEKELSQRVANILAKSALDMISLYLGGLPVFSKQILHLERSLPTRTYTLQSNGKYLNGLGFHFGKHVRPIFKNENHRNENREDLEEFLCYFKIIFDGLTDKKNCKFPKLANKWIFALSWYAEGVREPNDAIAITKLASCLDTLSHGSKNNGIKQLICNLFNKEDNQTLFNCEGNKTISIHEFSKRIYEDGRSRILHGTIDNFLESFHDDKERLIMVGRIILLECAVRLSTYEGDDSEHAFKTMKRKN
ncbi:TPA: hypothetical protein OMQ05_003418, partial [Acinetobacter baumannii]|nr:hypothetical protein [Acinetobacter baumannii]